MPHPTLQHPLLNREFKVLDHGSVTLVDFMGTDQDIIATARNCYKTAVKRSDDETLLRYLMRHFHSTPFERCRIALHVKLPIFVERQWVRHRTAGQNEVSGRYSELPEETYLPPHEDVCYQSAENRQGRSGVVDAVAYEKFRQGCLESSSVAFENYHEALADNIARETARINLPLSTYTEKTWWMDLHNIMHFLSLRMDSHAQKEIRVYADIIGKEIIAQLYPMTWQAFLDYRLNAEKFSAPELTLLSKVLIGRVAWKDLRATLGSQYVPEGMSKRECTEFVAKMDKLIPQ